MSVNLRHTKFAELYVLYGNATRAYAEAYDVVKTDGKFPHWASVEGHRLLRYPSVKAEMAKIRGENADLSSMERSEAIDYLIAVLNTPIDQIGPDSPFCEEYTVEDSGKIKTKSISKISALTQLARICGWNEAEKVEHSVGSDVTEMLKALSGAKK